MSEITLLLVLFLCTCGPAQMNAQPRTGPVRLDSNITAQTNYYHRKWDEAMASGQNGLGTTYRTDSMPMAVLGQTVYPGYLVDRRGTAWNLGVTEMPIVIHTFARECRNCPVRMEVINQVADKYAGEVLTFVLMPAPETATGQAIVEEFSNNVYVLYDDYFRDPYNLPKDARLLGLIGYPVTYYLDRELRIVGVSMVGSNAYLGFNKRKKKVDTKSKRTAFNLNNLERSIQHLLDH